MRKLLIIPIVVVSSASSAGDAVMLEAGAYEVQMRLELPHVETMNVQKTAGLHHRWRHARHRGDERKQPSGALPGIQHQANG